MDNMQKFNTKTFQGLLLALQTYWSEQGCTVLNPLDIEIGAATFHPMTFLNSLKKEPISFVYVQSCRRPTDGRYGINPSRLQHYYQLQVIIKPPKDNIQSVYLDSLKVLGIDPKVHDVRFIEDNWENPTLGAHGLGWEVRVNGLEITQFTYFQQMGSLDCKMVTSEITYGLERLAMHLQNVDSIYELVWNQSGKKKVTYKDLFFRNEFEQSTYNFKVSNVKHLLSSFEAYRKEATELLKITPPLPLVSYEHLLKAVHTFNLLDARKAISNTERQRYILSIRTLTKRLATTYLNNLS